MLKNSRVDVYKRQVQDYLNLLGYRMLDLYDGCAHPNDPLTRDHAADLLWQSVKYRQKYR